MPTLWTSWTLGCQLHCLTITIEPSINDLLTNQEGQDGICDDGP